MSYYYLSAIINSKLISFIYINTSTIAQKDDFRQTDLKTLRDLPIILPNETAKESLEKLAAELEENWKSFHVEKIRVGAVLKSKYKVKVGIRIANLHKYTNEEVAGDFPKLSLKETEELLEYLNEKRELISSISETIIDLENKIDNLIYQLYELTEEETLIVEDRIKLII
ncbi:hypothetical protein CEE45_05225 [Candidatus Heimdallarchaeota archaeon B3_Heim]|nr:MAG: hypothetical protein CEE45_05225 [Candidatus Heimdallarchaeota archaeon B3_Heim]